jgi:hypothetical protein
MNHSAANKHARHSFMHGISIVCCKCGIDISISSSSNVKQTCLVRFRWVLLLQNKTSLEAVQLVADLVRKRKCLLPPAVVSSLLVLRLEQVAPTSQGGQGVGGRQGQHKKAHKKKRKKSDLDKDFEEGEAGPDLRELALLQSQMLEVRMRRVMV